VVFREAVEDPLFGVNLQNSHRDHVLSASNQWSEPRSGAFLVGETVTMRIRFRNVLAPDRYHATPAVAAKAGGAWIDRRERLASVVVTGVRRTDAIVDLPYEVVLERGTQAESLGGVAG
jgi:hypothetical protein